MCFHRIDMPQIDDLEDFARWAAAQQGKKISPIKFPTGWCQVAQCCSEVRDFTVPHPKADYPILLSGDNYILDGNHRWATLKNEGKNILSVYKLLDMSLHQALAFVWQYPKVYRADEHNKRV